MGEVVFVLSLSGFSGAMSGAQLDMIGMRLREAAERITQFITGNKNAYLFKPSLAS